MIEGQLNILVLHRLGEPCKVRNFLWNHVYFLRNYAPEHNYIYHDVHFELPPYLIDVEFHAIIFDVTFLSLRTIKAELREAKLEELLFVRNSGAVKIAFPQDDYDHHAVLDEWMCYFNVDLVYTICPNHWDVLYPKYSKIGDIKLGFTGYLDEDYHMDALYKKFEDKQIDISYRARKLPYYFGRIGNLKSNIGSMFLRHSIDQGFNCDISNNPEDTYYGKKWLEFINNSKFVLASNSGSSLLDPYGNIGVCVHEYCQNNPLACFEEVEKECFPGLDGVYEFTMLSPRLIEATLMKSGQVMVRGEYNGIVNAWEDYIPLEADFSNKEEVFDAMRDLSYAKRIINNCYETIVNTPFLRYKNHAVEVIDYIRTAAEKKHIAGTDNSVMKKVLDKHETDHIVKSERYWKRYGWLKKAGGYLDGSFPLLYKVLAKVRRGLNYYTLK